MLQIKVWPIPKVDLYPLKTGYYCSKVWILMSWQNLIDLSVHMLPLRFDFLQWYAKFILFFCFFSYEFLTNVKVLIFAFVLLRWGGLARHVVARLHLFIILFSVIWRKVPFSKQWELLCQHLACYLWRSGFWWILGGRLLSDHDLLLSCL